MEINYSQLCKAVNIIILYYAVFYSQNITYSVFPKSLSCR